MRLIRDPDNRISSKQARRGEVCALPCRNLSRPGANLTGITTLNIELHPKRLELLSELVPQARVVALLVNPTGPQTERIIRQAQETTRAMKLQLHVLEASNESEIDAAFATLVKLHAD